MAVRRAATNGLDRLPQSVVRHPSSVLLDQLGWRAAEVYDVVTWPVLCSALGPLLPTLPWGIENGLALAVGKPYLTRVR